MRRAAKRETAPGGVVLAMTMRVPPRRPRRTRMRPSRGALAMSARFAPLGSARAACHSPAALYAQQSANV